MNFVAVTDISTFVWSQPHFEQNEYSYYSLTKAKINLFDLFTKWKVKQLFSKELQEIIWENFPYLESPISTKDYNNRIWQYLSKTEFIQHSYNNDPEITSEPELIKDFFNQKVKDEIQMVLTEIHTNETQKFTFFTFDIFWQNQTTLSTHQSSQKSKEYKTVISDKEQNTLHEYIDQHRPRFEHNPKHDKYKSGGKISPLSCYDENDWSIPQKLLESAVESNGILYNYDSTNRVWVIFRSHNGNNLYHGYDEVDENKIPNPVKNKLSM